MNVTQSQQRLPLNGCECTFGQIPVNCSVERKFRMEIEWSTVDVLKWPIQVNTVSGRDVPEFELRPVVINRMTASLSSQMKNGVGNELSGKLDGTWSTMSNDH